MYNDQYVNICIMINMYTYAYDLYNTYSPVVAGPPVLLVSHWNPKSQFQIICPNFYTEKVTLICVGGALKLWDQCSRGSFGISWRTANPSIANLKISQVENEVHGNFKWQIAFSWEKILWTQRFFHRWLSHPSDAHLALMFSISSIDDAAVSAQAPV